MKDFTFQYAVRLPNGTLYTKPKPSRLAYLFGELAQEHPSQRELAIFNDRADAEKVLDEMREAAATVGVDNLGATIVQRICSPFTGGSPAEEFAEVIAEWLEKQ